MEFVDFVIRQPGVKQCAAAAARRKPLELSVRAQFGSWRIPVADNGDAVASAFDEMLHRPRAVFVPGNSLQLSNVGVSSQASIRTSGRPWLIAESGTPAFRPEAWIISPSNNCPERRVVVAARVWRHPEVPGLLHERRQSLRGGFSVTSDSTSLGRTANRISLTMMWMMLLRPDFQHAGRQIDAVIGAFRPLPVL